MSRLSSYKFNIQKHIVRLLWHEDRTPQRVAWLMVLCKPLKLLYDQLNADMTGHLFEIQWNGQSMVLERFLQLKFGDGIQIINRAANKKVLLGYAAPDTRNTITYSCPNVSNPVTIESALGDFFNGFTVFVPIGLNVDEQQLRSEIIKRQIGPSPFKIEYI